MTDIKVTTEGELFVTAPQEPKQVTYKLKQTEVTRYEDEFGHSYEIDGQPIIGVTTILSMGVPAESGLINWWKNKTPEEGQAILEDAQERGSNVHQAIETLLFAQKVIPLTFKRKRERDSIEAFMDFYRTVQPTDYRTEQVVAFTDEKFQFAGTLDFVATINGKRILIDFKTSKVASKKNSLQVEAYKRAIEQSYDEEIYACYILYLGSAHKGMRVKTDENGIPTTGKGWFIVKSEDTFEDFERAYDMAIWLNGGEYPRPPKVRAYPEFWQLLEVDKYISKGVKDVK